MIRSVAQEPGISNFIVFEFYDFPRLDGPNIMTALHGWKCADIWQLDEENHDQRRRAPQENGRRPPRVHPQGRVPTDTLGVCTIFQPQGYRILVAQARGEGEVPQLREDRVRLQRNQREDALPPEPQLPRARPARRRAYTPG